MCFEENSAKQMPDWHKSVQSRAQELLSQFTLGKQTINSLAFKTALRDTMGPEFEISQKDTSAFLRRWFFGEGGNQTYDTVRNATFITYAPQLTEDQKALDAAIEKQIEHRLTTTGAAPGLSTGEPVAISNPITGIVNIAPKK